jgi:GcrA cell cycle regulator
MLNFWNDQRIARLKFLWEEGMTCAAIAADMGAPSRSAIIGKVHRLGLSQRKK